MVFTKTGSKKAEPLITDSTLDCAVLANNDCTDIVPYVLDCRLIGVEIASDCRKEGVLLVLDCKIVGCLLTDENNKDVVDIQGVVALVLDCTVVCCVLTDIDCKDIVLLAPDCIGSEYALPVLCKDSVPLVLTCRDVDCKGMIVLSASKIIVVLLFVVDSKGICERAILLVRIVVVPLRPDCTFIDVVLAVINCREIVSFK